MNFKEIYKSKKRVFSFEFFPPKTEEKIDRTKELIKELSKYNPDFMTVTYGAGGKTQSFTAELVEYISKNLNTSAVAHLTCVGHSKDDIIEYVKKLEDNGVHHILALRGDPPAGTKEFKPRDDELTCALDLVRLLKKTSESISLAVAGYPETHPDALSNDADIDYLKEKTAAGGEVIFTQLFFDTEKYFSFVNKAKEKGISTPIVPGIMPISNYNQLLKFTEMCGASIPENIKNDLEKIKNDKIAVKEYGTKLAVKLCRSLLNDGAPGIHFYTLNKPKQIKNILDQLSIQ